MRPFALLILILLLGGCAPWIGIPRTRSGEPAGVGVLVQATRGRCTSVLVGERVHRVCVPPLGAAAEPDGERPDSLAAASTPAAGQEGGNESDPEDQGSPARKLVW